jgi:hypothetical protein
MVDGGCLQGKVGFAAPPVTVRSVVVEHAAFTLSDFGL